jgi:hypothetical protein
MKNPLKKTKTKVLVPWRQDFRNSESLPDIKVIRTQFLINFVAVVVPLFVAILWIQQELALGSLRQDLGKLEEKKVAMQSANSELVALSRDFMKESAKIDSLDQYYYNLFSISDYLVTLSKNVSENMVLSSMEIKKSNRIEGNDVIDVWESKVSGNVTQENQGAITSVNTFVEDLGKEELLALYLDEAFLDNLSRDQNTDTLNFVVSIAMSGTEKKEKTLSNE